MFTQRSNAASDTTNCKNSIKTGVSCLVNSSRPANVAQFIASVVVNSFKAPAFLPLSNVFKEIRKGLPSLANFYASPTVVLIGLVGLIAAPIQHSGPNGMDSLMRHPVLEWRSGANFSTPASTRFGVPIFHGIVLDGANVAARALADGAPVYFPFAVNVIRPLGKHFQSSKRLSDDGVFFRHGIADFNVMLAAGVRRQPALVAIIKQTDTDCQLAL